MLCEGEGSGALQGMMSLECVTGLGISGGGD